MGAKKARNTRDIASTRKSLSGERDCGNSASRLARLTGHCTASRSALERGSLLPSCWCVASSADLRWIEPGWQRGFLAATEPEAGASSTTLKLQIHITSVVLLPHFRFHRAPQKHMYPTGN